MVGGCNAHYDYMSVCYRMSRWVYVIGVVQADAELIVLGELQGGDAEKHLCLNAE